MSTPKDMIAEIGTKLTINATSILNPALWYSLLPLQQDAYIAIVQNDMNVAISLSADGTIENSIPFTAGTKLVLDLRANHGVADNYLFRKGKIFYVNGPIGGTGSFSISVIYSR